ncbi:copper-binding protein [Massilia niastensis]|uniref:copper-binding protein n=1 Tax=Massilia niastensis TaxID=544911 RepID=UPI00035CF742|nr:copper-binding protein [Massilia niastensis]
MKTLRTLALAAMLASSASVLATEAALSEGEIRKVNKDASTLTIRHGELKNLGMMPMTMVFKVKDKDMLERAAVGDKVRFLAEKVDGALTVTALEADKIQ